jgi:hypothetical protein
MWLILIVVIVAFIIAIPFSKKIGSFEPKNVALISESTLKTNALKSALSSVFQKDFDILNVSSAGAEIPNQPVDTGKECAEYRIEWAKKHNDLSDRTIVAVEGAANKIDGSYYEIADVAVEHDGKKYYGRSKPILCPMDGDQILKFEAQEKIYTPDTKIWGYPQTGNAFLSINADKWNPNREKQIEEGMINALNELKQSV